MPLLSTIYETIKTHCKNDFSSFQLYISGDQKWLAPPRLDIEDLKKAREELECHREVYVVIHGSLRYNLAGNVDGRQSPKYKAAITRNYKALAGELDYGVALGNIGIVVHPGSAKNKSEGIEDIASTIVKALTYVSEDTVKVASMLGISNDEVCSKRRVILENAAGEGTKICSTLEEISQVIKSIPKKYRKQVRVCIDTAHSCGAGIYDWGKGGEVDRFYKDFDDVIGLKYLEVFHLNDSLVPFKSKKDRHQSLGMGYIFGEGINQPSQERLVCLSDFIIKAKEHKIPMICETPSDTYFIDWQLIIESTSETECPICRIVDMNCKK